MRRWRKATRDVAVLSSAAWMFACAADEGDPRKAAPGTIVETNPSEDDFADAGKVPEPSDSKPRPSDGGNGTGIDAGTKDAAPSSDTNDPSTPASTCTSCPIVLRYKTPTTGSDQNIRPHFDLYNNGTSPQPLAELTVRYWFTSEGSSNLTYECDYAQIGCANTKSGFGSVAGKATADHYFELSFTGGTIAAGGHTGEIQARLHDSAFGVTFTQSNDYSFDETKGSFVEWDHVTVYRNGTLVFGVEP